MSSETYWQTRDYRELALPSSSGGWLSFIYIDKCFILLLLLFVYFKIGVDNSDQRRDVFITNHVKKTGGPIPYTSSSNVSAASSAYLCVLLPIHLIMRNPGYLWNYFP